MSPCDATLRLFLDGCLGSGLGSGLGLGLGLGSGLGLGLGLGFVKVRVTTLCRRRGHGVSWV